MEKIALPTIKHLIKDDGEQITLECIKSKNKLNYSENKISIMLYKLTQKYM